MATLPSEKMKGLKEQPLQDAQAKKGFAGRTGLVEVMQDSQREKVNHEVISSRVVLETVMQVVSARTAVGEYENLLIRYASLISEKRGTPSPEPSQQFEMPANDEEALKKAIERIGLRAEIKERKPSSSGQFNLFILSVNGENCRIMLPTKVMESQDPVSEAMKYARNQGIRTRDEEQSSKLERRRVSRPPSLPVSGLGIDQSELGKRNVTYDGVEERTKYNFFTFLGEGAESTVGIAPTFTGKGLLAELDRKIFSLHIQFRTAFQPRVLEEISQSSRSTPGIESIAQGNIKAISKSLDILVSGSEIDMELVPAEYKEAVQKIRESKEYRGYSTLRSNGVLTNEDVEAFSLAIEGVDHPANVLARSINRGISGPNGELGDEDIKLITDHLKLSGTDSSSLCDRALQNIAEAHDILYGTKYGDSDVESLRKNHFRMMFQIRRGILRSLPSDVSRMME